MADWNAEVPRSHALPWPIWPEHLCFSAGVSLYVAHSTTGGFAHSAVTSNHPTDDLLKAVQYWHGWIYHVRHNVLAMFSTEAEAGQWILVIWQRADVGSAQLFLPCTLLRSPWQNWRSWSLFCGIIITGQAVFFKCGKIISAVVAVVFALSYVECNLTLAKSIAQWSSLPS